MGSQCCASKVEASVDAPDAPHTDEIIQLPADLTQGIRVYPTPLLYVEKHCRADDVGSTVFSTGSAGSAFRPASGSFRPTMTKAINVIQGEAVASLISKLDKQKLAAFKDQLAKGGVDTSEWGKNDTKTIQHLFWEVHVQRGSIILSSGSRLKRFTHLLKLRMLTDIFGVEHILLSRLQMVYSGETSERRQLPLVRLTWREGFTSEDIADPLLSSNTCPYIEKIKVAVKRLLKERLGLTDVWQEQYLEEDVHAQTYRVEDESTSPGFPGLVTCYAIHEVTLRIADPENAGVACIGLPAGDEFATTEGDFNFSMFQQEEGFPIGTQLNIWAWQTLTSYNHGGTETGAKEDAKTQQPKAATPAAQSKDDEQQKALQAMMVKQVPVIRTTASLQELLQALASSDTSDKKSTIVQSLFGGKSQRTVPNYEDAKSACPLLMSVQEGQKTDWAKVRAMAKNICLADYSLRTFYSDIAAFPELAWYLLDQGNESNAQVASTSGRSLNVEFQRTVGAFFAIYWLVRLKGDGKEGFSFGVDKNWRPVQMKKDGVDDNGQLYPPEKRIKFYQDSDWSYFEKLLVDAEVFLKDKRGQLQINEKRLVTLLSLTAIHDLMKVHFLLPTVQQKHAPYHNYKAGDTIADHDHALSYVMDHFPHLLPSFNSLDPEEKLSIKFTQCQLQFNHGWLVQAEAPPGAIFTQFRELLIRDHKTQIKERDIALYFVHWLTDLAGAEPTPLGGCEKFVVKFPLPVLNSFLRSFSYVQKISTKTETMVMEEYLCMRWQESDLKLGSLPSGDGAIAKMRLLCMAQMNARPILKAFEQLSAEDQRILSVEMSRTGCTGQCFSKHLCPQEVTSSPQGPALLIYYGPAFLQSLGNDDPVKRLAMLAEIYRCARELWSSCVAKVGQSVIVRVDTVKALSIEQILENKRQGKVWLLVKHNESEAFVESCSMRKVNTFITTRHDVQVLDLLG